MKTDTLTFSIEKLDNVDGVWLCAHNINSPNPLPLAMFLDDEKRLLFTKVLNNALASAHAKGQLGI